MASAKKPIPEGYHAITPQLTLDDAARAIDWYKKALGATEISRAVGPDGKIMHAASLPTTTVTSSRWRLKSLYKTAATTAG